MKAVFQQTFPFDKLIKVTTSAQGFVLKLVFFCGGCHKRFSSCNNITTYSSNRSFKEQKNDYFSRSKLNKDCFFMVMLDSSFVRFLKDQLIFKFFFAA